MGVAKKECAVKYVTDVNGQSFEIELNRNDELLINGEVRTVDFRHNKSHGIFSLIIDNQSYEAIVENRDGKLMVMIYGALYEVTVEDERARRLAAAGGGLKSAGNAVTAPMPGLIVDVLVEEGQHVEAGQTVVILESMKMQNELKSALAGTIDKVNVATGDNVEQNKVLVAITPEDAEA